ncbi:MAG: bifunctional UDP-N-acetylglucosamine diphosphorylase/glucosamine-1-phosphate N-acetyltransferase GlmU [Candidatus Bipolaricaulota bacterium]
MNSGLDVVILAAGKGTRMRSQYPKVLHRLAGAPLLEHVLRAAAGVSPDRSIVVLGHKGEQVQAAFADRPLSFVTQDPPLGTGHAIQCTRHEVTSPVFLVLPGDVPLIPPEALIRLVELHRESGALLTLLTAELDDPRAYGRVLRDKQGRVSGVVEAADANAEELTVREVNSGVYCLANRPELWEALDALSPVNAQGELYLTDLVSATARKRACSALVWPHSEDLIGINDRRDLAKAERTLGQRTLEELMLSGITVVDPERTYVSPESQLGQDTVLFPGTHLEGACRVGRNCRVGPGAQLIDTRLEDGATVKWSVLEGARVGAEARVGPYAHLRPGTQIGSHARVGNFVEVKAASLGDGAKAGHLAYIGDATVGARVNIGAGAITCNYDGVSKHHTQIGAGAFIGSNVSLVAPVTVGDQAVVGAGSVIVQDVPPGALAVARARQAVKPDWKQHREVA